MLFSAALNGDIPTLEWWIDNGADINEKTEYGSDILSPLHIAVVKKHHAIARILLQLGSDHSSPRYRDNLKPIHDAASRNDVEMVDLLLHFGADINCRDRLLQTPLHLATYRNFPDVVSFLLRNGADMNARTCFIANDSSVACHGLTPMEMVRSMENRYDTNRDEVRELLEAEHARRDIAFLMGQHARLGENSPAHPIDPEIARMIMKFI
jgi:ankyrin repeat protein